jgi:hypothetical protein
MSPGTDKIRSAAAEAVAGPSADTRHALRVSVMSPATRPTTVVGPVPVVKDGIVSRCALFRPVRIHALAVAAGQHP